MKRWLFAVALVAGLPASGATASALLPAPRSTLAADGELARDGPFRIEWSGYRDRWLDSAAARFVSRTSRGLSGQPVVLRIHCRARDPQLLSVAAHEAYSLRIDASGVTLRADAPTGILRGLSSLRQLASARRMAFAEIEDSPRFRWRGLMIDVARHFMTIESLERQIDAMEAVKLNVLHLHLSDNEGFRVESRRFPRLTMGEHGQFYTQTQIRTLIAYAGERGVRIVPEFDVPGHSLAILKAYPALSSSPPRNRNYLTAMNAALNPVNPAVDRFVAALFGEMAGLFPDGWFHVGGDEVNGVDWQRNPAIARLMARHKLTTGDLQARFMVRVRAVLRRHGKVMIGWDEVADHPIPGDVAIQLWRGSALAAPIADGGHRLIVSAGYYLDRLEPAGDYYRRDPLDPAAVRLSEADLAVIARTPALAAAFPPSLVARMKAAPVALTPHEAGMVMGGEGALWSEAVSDEMLDARLWPRAAALAERFWSPASARDDGSGLAVRLEREQALLRLDGLRDEAARRAMIGRLAPGDEPPVSTLLDLVAPTPFHPFQHLKALLQGQTPAPQTLDELADIAAPDSFVVAHFDRDVGQLLAGDPTKAAAIRSDLVRWRDNDAGFVRAAAVHPRLQPGLPVSADVARLAAAGIEALDAIAAGKALADDRLAAARALLDRQRQADRASASLLQGLANPQPPADLLIGFSDGVARLVSGASKAPSRAPGAAPR